MLRTALAAVIGATISLSAITGCSMLGPADPIDQYLDEVRDVAAAQLGSRPSDDDGQFNTAALLGAAFTCGLKDNPHFAQGVQESIETNPVAKIASKYCDTAFNDPLTDEERARYGIRLPGLAAPSSAPAYPAASATPPPPAQVAVDAVTDAQDAAAKLDQAPAFTGYTCEPDADARMDDPSNPNMITNKSCDDLTAKKEAAQREYAEHMSIGDNAVPEGYCDPYTRMHLDGTSCNPGEGN